MCFVFVIFFTLHRKKEAFKDEDGKISYLKLNKINANTNTSQNGNSKDGIIQEINTDVQTTCEDKMGRESGEVTPYTLPTNISINENFIWVPSPEPNPNFLEIILQVPKNSLSKITSVGFDAFISGALAGILYH